MNKKKSNVCLCLHKASKLSGRAHIHGLSSQLAQGGMPLTPQRNSLGLNARVAACKLPAGKGPCSTSDADQLLGLPGGMLGGVTEEAAMLCRHLISALGNTLFYLGAQADTVYVLHRQDPLLIILSTVNKKVSEQGEGVLPGSIPNNEWQHQHVCSNAFCYVSVSFGLSTYWSLDQKSPNRPVLCYFKTRPGLRDTRPNSQQRKRIVCISRFAILQTDSRVYANTLLRESSLTPFSGGRKK